MIFLRCFAPMLFALLEIQAKTPIGNCSGWYARLGQFPSMVGTDQCGGVLVNLQYVLSTASCFAHRVRYHYYRTIFVGVLKWPSGESTKQLRNFVDVKIHEKFDEKTMIYDFALMRLEKPFVKTARVYPIPLATHRPEKTTQCQTAAWGKKRKDEMDQYNLKYINVKPLNFEMCAFLHPSLKETSSQICAGAAGEQDDICQGESSDERLQCSTGPLICNGVVAGLVSATKACNKAGHYAIYADVSAVKTWIDESIKEWDQLCGDYFRSGTLGTYPGLILPIYIILY